jgi:2-C-methyl-D-erythritol 4-phosphate cytidylyltransferase / 2-C-methyl-D-erythritol 2,4-cyclodiphosphate synthase
MKVIALIVAGGSSQRFGGNLPKQYTNVANVTILEQTIKKFLSSKLIDAVQVVIRQEDNEIYKQVTRKFDLLPVCFGGLTRCDSVKHGLTAIEKHAPEFVLVHDACRPYLSVKLIDEIVKNLIQKEHIAVVPSIAITETIKRATHNKIELVDRSNLFIVQTPQGFSFKEIFKLSHDNNKNFNDESSLFESYNIPVHYIAGERENIKVTIAEDKCVKDEIRTGSGFDAHRFSEETGDYNVTLGGINIPFERKLEAHSDGDVLIHALVDAILGSIGEGDIGMHFPPSDMKWKNANSEDFLIHANQLLKEKYGSINNLDVTVICEKPRLGSYREEIRSNIAKILGITEDRVNIKATTTEKMGFTGRGEGIAVSAIVTVSLS